MSACVWKKKSRRLPRRGGGEIFFNRTFIFNLSKSSITLHEFANVGQLRAGRTREALIVPGGCDCFRQRFQTASSKGAQVLSRPADSLLACRARRTRLLRMHARPLRTPRSLLHSQCCILLPPLHSPPPRPALFFSQTLLLSSSPNSISLISRLFVDQIK